MSNKSQIRTLPRPLHRFAPLRHLHFQGYGDNKHHVLMGSWGRDRTNSHVHPTPPPRCQRSPQQLHPGQHAATYPVAALLLVQRAFHHHVSCQRVEQFCRIEKRAAGVSSQPVGEQRKSYFLQLPYRFAVPLILFSILLHWLVAQSLFLVSVEFYSTKAGSSLPPTLVEDKSITSCGWSPVAIVCVIIFGTVLTGILVGVGAHRLSSGMPVAGSCSLAMAAACHPVPYEPDAWMKRVTWGVSAGERGDDWHCSFTSRPDVEYPSTQHVYS